MWRFDADLLQITVTDGYRSYRDSMSRTRRAKEPGWVTVELWYFLRPESESFLREWLRTVDR